MSQGAAGPLEPGRAELGSRLRLPRFTDRIALGHSGLKVSPFCIGIVHDPAVVIDAFDAGINFFFLTADMHWPLYEGTRLGLAYLLAKRASVRRELVVAVASYVAQPEFCTRPFEEVLGVVAGLDRVDVAVVGGAYPHDFFVRLTEYQRQRPGNLRALGATFHHRPSAVTAINHGLVDVAFVRYNAAHPGAEQDVLPRLRAERAARLFSFNSSSGHVAPSRLVELGVPETRWRPRLVDHYRFALTPPQVDGLLCALGEKAHLTELSAALAQGRLSGAEQTYLQTLSMLDAGEVTLTNPT